MENLVGFEIRTISNLIRRRMERPLPGEDKFQPVCGWALRYICHHQERPLYQRDFEETFCIRRSTATGILQTMERRGLIRRESVEEDGRLKRLVVTAAGLRINALLEQRIQCTEELLTKGLSCEERTQLFALMAKIRKNLEEEENV